MSDEKLKKVAAALPREIRKLANYPVFKLGKNALHKVQEMMKVVFEAALNSTSVETISALKEGSPSADTIRGHLDWKLSIAAVEGMLKDRMRWMATLLKRIFGRVEFDIAIDWTDEPYYGDKNNQFIIGMEPKAGTCWAYEFFTASILVDGGRLLFFAYPLYDRGNLLYEVNRALLFLNDLGLKASLLLFDRGFRSTDLFAHLNEEKIPFISPAVHDSKFDRWAATLDEFPAIFRGWNMQNDAGETVEIDMVVQECFAENREGKLERHLYGFYTNLTEKTYKENVGLISEYYRKRWGIETAHRCEDDYRIKSTSVSGVARYFYFVVSCLVYDLWVYLNLLFCEKIDEFKIFLKKDVMRLMGGRLLGKFRL